MLLGEEVKFKVSASYVQNIPQCVCVSGIRTSPPPTLSDHQKGFHETKTPSPVSRKQTPPTEKRHCSDKSSTELDFNHMSATKKQRIRYKTGTPLLLYDIARNRPVCFSSFKKFLFLLQDDDQKHQNTDEDQDNR